MNISISKSDIVWSYLGYVLRMCSGFFLLPLLLVKLSSDELGVWYVFLSIGALIQLLDIGFSPTITRNVSYAFAGATNLLAKGIDQEQTLSGKPNYELIFQLIKVAKKIYFFISCIAIILLLTAGMWYINHITKDINNTSILTAWGIYSTGIFFNFYYSYWLYVLTGIGKIQESQKATILSQLCYIGIAFVGLTFSYGLIAVASAFLISGFILRFFCQCYFKSFIPMKKIILDEKRLRDLYKIVWYNAKKMGIVSLGAFLILQANTLICSTFCDLKTTASYGLTLQLINVLIAFSGVLFRTYLPVINEAMMKKDVLTVEREMSKTFVFGWLTYLIGAIIIGFFGHKILQLMGSNTVLLESNMVFLMLLYLFLEFNHSNFATIITAKNEVPFVGVSILSGVGIFICALINIVYFDLGIWGMLLAQFFVQLAYNNWRWPLYVMRELRISLKDIIFIGAKEICYLVCKRGRYKIGIF